MNLILETTTGRLVPAGDVPRLGRGPTPTTLQFMTNGVAALLPDGAPAALKLYDPADPATVIATFAAWTAVPGSLAYTAQLNPLAVEALAWLRLPTLLGRISYGNPNVDSTQFHVSFGEAGVTGAPAVQVIITQPSGPVNYAQAIGTFGGKLILNQVEGFWKAPAPCNVLGFQLSAQDAPTGSDAIVEATLNGVATGKTAKLTAAAKNEQTLFGAALAMAAGDVLRFKPTQIGATKPGTNLNVSAVIQLT